MRLIFMRKDGQDVSELCPADPENHTDLGNKALINAG